MTDSSRLERRYRRVLACYPKAFRRENGEEIVAVLLATAHEGQRRVGVAASADLIMGAVRMHFGMSRAPRPVRNAVRLMCAGAVLTVADVVTVLVTLGGVRSAAVQDLTAAQWPTVMLTQVGLCSPAHRSVLACGCGWPGRTAGVITGRGPLLWRSSASSLIVLLFGLGEGDGAHALPYTRADLIATTVLCLVALVAMLLIVSETASPYYQQEPAQQ